MYSSRKMKSGAEIANRVRFMAADKRQPVFLTRRKKGREREMDQLKNNKKIMHYSVHNIY